MTEQHPDAKLLADLIDNWAETAMKKQLSGVGYAREIAKKTLEWAAPVFRQQGADTELEACCEWLDKEIGAIDPVDLRAARRPKPPSLKAQAFAALKNSPVDPVDETLQLSADAELIIRKALSLLNDDN